MRTFTFSDRVIGHLDRGIRTLWGMPLGTGRTSPGRTQTNPQLSESSRRHAVGLMRVDLAGEVAAQALYQGQAVATRTPTVRRSLQRAAQEENDHLIWCHERLAELGASRSVLDPVWFCGGFIAGALAGLMGDRVSFGFLAETEHQVVEHLDTHLEQLPEEDVRSRAILQQMRKDEDQHATTALHSGAVELPGFVKLVMRRSARIMTRTAYWV